MLMNNPFGCLIAVNSFTAPTQSSEFFKEGENWKCDALIVISELVHELRKAPMKGENMLPHFQLPQSPNYGK